MVIYDRVYILLLSFSLCKSRFVAYNLREKKKRSRKDIAIKKEEYSYQKKDIQLSKKGDTTIKKRDIYSNSVNKAMISNIYIFIRIYIQKSNYNIIESNSHITSHMIDITQLR